MRWADAIDANASGPTPERCPAWLTSPERFYAKLEQILDGWRFDRLVEGLCARFYGEARCAVASLPAHTYFRFVMIGLFEGIPSEEGVAWRLADSEVLRRFLGAGRAARVPDVARVAATRSRIDRAMHEEVLRWVLTVLADCVAADGAGPIGGEDGVEGLQHGDRDGRLPWARGRQYLEFLNRFLSRATVAAAAATRVNGTSRGPIGAGALPSA